MGYSLQIGLSDAVPFASVVGLKELRRHVESLPQSHFPHLKTLLEKGWTNAPDRLKAQVAGAVKVGDPPATVVSTLKDMAHSLQVIPKGALVVSITDGLGD